MNLFRDFFLRMVLLTLPSKSVGETFAPFVRKGRVLRVKAVIDLTFVVDFSKIRESCKEVKDIVKQMHNSRHADEAHFKNSVKRTVQETERLCQNPIFSLSHSDTLLYHRSKRQILLPLLTGALASYAVSNLFSSSTHSAEIENHNFKVLDKEMQDLQTYVGLLSTRIEAVQSRNEAQLRLVQIQSFLQSTRFTIESLSSGFIDLIQGKLSERILPISQAKRELASISKLATTFKAHLPFGDVLSFYTFPVTHSIEGNIVTFKISLPVVDEAYLNWRFLQAPIAVEHFTESIFVTPIPAKEYLAVPESGISVALSQADLDHCTQWSDDFFCTYLPTRRNDDACLEALFHEPTDVISTCDFKIPSFPKYVLTHLNENQFLLSLNISSLSFEEICPSNGKRNFGEYRQGQTLINVTTGCSISTKLFDIPSFTSIKKEVRIRPFSPSINDSRFFSPDIPHLSEAFSLLQHRSLRILENDSPWVHWPFHLSTLIIIVIIVITMFAVLRCVYARRKRPKT